MRVIAAAPLALVLALVACRTASTERVLYQWSDAEGNVRYTTLPEAVPRASRETLNQVQPGRSAQENASLMPGSITEPRPPESPREWLAGQEPPEETDAGVAASEAEVAEQAAVPTTEEEVSLAQRMGEPESEDGNPVDEAAVREASNHLPQLQAELEELRSRRQMMTPAPNEH
jgi:hypothetical protein